MRKKRKALRCTAEEQRRRRSTTTIHDDDDVMEHHRPHGSSLELSAAGAAPHYNQMFSENVSVIV